MKNPTPESDFSAVANALELPVPNDTLASGSRSAACDPRYSNFITYVVLDKRAAGDIRGFDEVRYPGERLSDHCPIVAVLEK